MQVCLRVEADARGEVSYNAHYATHLPTGEAGSVGRARWWRRRSVAEHALITIAEAMPVVFNRRRWHGWIAETRMPGGVGRPTGGDIATRRFNPIVKAVLRNFGIAEWRRRRSIDHGLRVRATGNSQRHCQYSKCKCFAHVSVLEISTNIVKCGIPDGRLSKSDTDLRQVLHAETILRLPTIAQCRSSESGGFRNLDRIGNFLEAIQNQIKIAFRTRGDSPVAL